MTTRELLHAHRCRCQECAKGFCTPATVLELMAKVEEVARATD